MAVVCSDHGETPLYITYKTETQFLNAVSCVCNGSVCCWEESENTQKPRNHYRISAATRVANTPSPPRPQASPHVVAPLARLHTAQNNWGAAAAAEQPQNSAAAALAMAAASWRRVRVILVFENACFKTGC